MENNIPLSELLKKIQELEQAHADLTQKISNFKLSVDSDKLRRPRRRTAGGGVTAAAFKVSLSSPLRKESHSVDVIEENDKCSGECGGDGDGVGGPSESKLMETQYLNICSSLGQSIHMFDLNGHIIYWNQNAQNLYGYSAMEAIGKRPTEIIIEARHASFADLVLKRTTKGDSWSGELPVRTKTWERMIVVTTITPFHDENGTIMGVMCLSSDVLEYREMMPMVSVSEPSRVASARLGLDPRQPMQTSIASKISDLASKFSRTGRSGWHWLHNDHEHESLEAESQPSRNTNRNTKVDAGGLDYEILWEDLVIEEQIGQGSYGTVYHALWYGSDVAVKVFSKLEYPHDVLQSFRQEVSLMKRLRHPNILLFMGAVTSPRHLCIITEVLTRGSLLRLLQRNTKLDWRRRIHMAMDIARGMNYLHHCNPPIIHRDLKSSNLLVDKNWNVKVGDFGLSRIKNDTYLKTKTRKGTPQWMAPEILRNEQADEKSDVYSYGVVLWELTTEKIPWDSLNAMQVIGAVGFMNQQLDIPKDVDPQWASIIESCWCSEPQSRPTFQEILDKLKDLQKKFAVQLQASRMATAGNDNQKNSKTR